MLGHVDDGFYIDVGAWHPVDQSVTKAFYDRGWSGVNVEPQAHYFELLCRSRPRDTNLNVAIAAEEGPVSLWVPRYSALATCRADYLDESIADYRDATESRVDSCTLDSIFNTYASAKDVHFLKVDIEGLEEAVICGTDFRRYRPWILVVEATSPHTGEPMWQSWEPWLIECDYRMVDFDGLNRFYVRSESIELMQSV